MDRSRSVMRRIGYELLEDRKMAAEMNTGKDLLSLLVKANIADKDGMSDEDVIARTSSSRLLITVLRFSFRRGSDFLG